MCNGDLNVRRSRGIVLLTSWKGEIKLKQEQKSTLFLQVRHAAFPRHMFETKNTFSSIFTFMSRWERSGKTRHVRKKEKRNGAPSWHGKGGRTNIGQKKKRRRKRWEMMMSGGERKKASFSYFCNFRTWFSRNNDAKGKQYISLSVTPIQKLWT